MRKDVELALFEVRVEAVSRFLEDIPKMGPTSRKEAEIVRGMMKDVHALGEKAIKRRRLK